MNEAQVFKRLDVNSMLHQIVDEIPKIDCIITFLGICFTVCLYFELGEEIFVSSLTRQVYNLFQ